MEETIDNLPEGFELDTLPEGFELDDKNLSLVRPNSRGLHTPEQINNYFKQNAQYELAKRKVFEENHPYLTRVNKDFNPMYRGQLAEWENQAKYGINSPLKEQFKTSLKQLTSPIIPALNMTIAAETGGLGTTGSLGKQILGQMGAGAIQGGSSNALNTIGDMRFKDIIPETIDGTIGGGIIGGLLPIGGTVGNGIKNLGAVFGKNYMTGIARIKPTTLEQVVKPFSKALDYTDNETMQLLMNTTERVRNAYNNLLSKRGQAVNDAIDNLRGNEYRVPLEDLKSDIKSTFDQYGGELINPARNMTGSLERNLNELVSSGTSDPRTTLGLDNNFITNNIDPLTRNINEAELSYRQLLNNVVNNANDQNIYAKAGDDLYNIVKNLPEDVQGSFYERLGNDLDTIYNKTQTISPIDLQKAKQQIGHMVNWSDETARNYQNPILEQIYNKYNRRLSDLSPELEKANRQFANLRSFQKNEGLNRILKAGNNIDSASSALKNYNSTVTKGNTGRNIKDLENILVANGSEPFLNTVDDINAAMDLLNLRTTGDSVKANTATLLARPILKGVRAYNRFLNDMPQNHPFLNSIYNKGVRPVNKLLKETKGAIIKPLLYRGLPLKGQVEYYDELE